MSTRWEVERAVLASDLPATGRLVALALLTFTDNGTAVVSRQHGPSLTGLAHATGLGRSTVAGILNRLESGGWVKRERPDPALARTRGARTRYTLCPVMAGPRAELGSPGAGPEPVQELDQGSPALGPGVVQQNRTPSPAAGHSPDSRASQQRALPGSQMVTDKTDATEDEAKKVLELIQAERQPRSLVALVRRIGIDGELGEWLARVRANGQRAEADEAGRRQHYFQRGRSVGYCGLCGRHETNRVHLTGWWDN